jgi:hypothetical protein
MSVSSTTSVAPSVAEALLRRVFARPPKPFVDGDLMEAFGHVHDGPDTALDAEPASRVDITV